MTQQEFNEKVKAIFTRGGFCSTCCQTHGDEFEVTIFFEAYGSRELGATFDELQQLSNLLSTKNISFVSSVENGWYGDFDNTMELVCHTTVKPWED